MRRLAVSLAALAAGLCALAAEAQDAARGRALYAGTCAACHGDPPGSGSVNPLVRSGDEIRAALTRVSPMRFLSEALTATDLADIAAYFEAVLGPLDHSPPFDVTGQWASQSQPWWGLFVTHYANRSLLTGAWLTFDEKGEPRWLYFYESGSWIAPSVYSAALFRNTGPPFGLPPDRGAEAPHASPVGSIAFIFGDRDNADVTFEVDSTRASHRISRVHRP